jgi:toxin YhaV
MVVNGWTIFAHPLFLDEINTLIEKVEALKSKDPVNYIKKNASKRLAAIAKLAFEVIPQDPASSEYRQGSTLGNEYKYWFRAKFFQQYRLFFRFDSASKIIVFAWANDDKNKRAYGSKTDAYRVFEKMLTNGYPPDNWDKPLKEAKGNLYQS